MEKRLKRIIILSGKARSGKDTTAGIINEIYTNKGLKCLNLQYSSYIKEYAKTITNWDGLEETKPRSLLQQLGTDVIRKQIDELFFVKRIIGDIKVYSYYYDIITISDCRAKVEIDIPKTEFDNIFAIRITRPNFDNGLTEEQKKHFTETDLDDYARFDYELINDGTIDDLKNKVNNLLSEVENER